MDEESKESFDRLRDLVDELSPDPGSASEPALFGAPGVADKVVRLTAAAPRAIWAERVQRTPMERFPFSKLSNKRLESKAGEAKSTPCRLWSSIVVIGNCGPYTRCLASSPGIPRV